MSVKRIGLTGGIATGKSTVSRYLNHLGYVVLDSDQFAHEAYQDADVYHEIETYFPSCVSNGMIDRQALGRLVFEDPDQKKKLESIIHPYVKARLHQGIQQHHDQGLIFLDIPLLFEAHMEDFCDEIWVVNLSWEAQLERLIKRNGLSEAEALSRMKSQWPLREKCAQADFVIDNNGDLASLYAQIDQRLEADDHA